MKAIILLHGFLTDKNDFKRIIPYLEQIYDNVVLYEAPGHTLEPNYDLFDAELTIKTLIECYDEVAKSFEKIDVIGFSMGGALATYLQQVRPINKLVLLAPANKYLNFNILPSHLKFYYSIKRQIKHNKSAADIQKYLKKQLEHVKKDDKLALQFEKRFIPNYNIHNLTQFIKVVNICNKNLISISCKTLILWGKMDQLVPYKSVKFLKKLLIDDSNIIIYDDISHLMLSSSNYIKIINDILDFLN